MSRVLICAVAAWALAQAAALGATASPPTAALVYVVRLPSGQWTKVSVTSLGAAGIKISFSKGEGEGEGESGATRPLTKTFDRDVAVSLEKIWGSKTAGSFDVSEIEPDRGCLKETTWWLRSGENKRTICRNRTVLNRLDEFQGTIQLLMR